MEKRSWKSRWSTPLSARVLALLRPPTTARLGLALLLIPLAGCGGGEHSGDDATASRANRVVRIVRAKQLVALAVLEQQKTLERALEPHGVSVQWLEFLAGPQQLEALNAGALDIASTAESPAVFAQAAGADIVYLATTPPNGKSVAMLVPKDSKVEHVADLKGKRIAFQKASIGHYLLIKALERDGLGLKDVLPTPLTPPDANAAFSEAKVDAWLIWEPYVARALQNGSGRILIDGDSLRDTGNFYTTSRAFAESNPDVLKIFLDALQSAEHWSAGHRSEMSRLLSPSLMIDVPTLELMHAKYDFRVLPITEPVIQKQQEVADLWFRLGLLPVRVDVRKGFLSRDQYAGLMPVPSGGGS